MDKIQLQQYLKRKPEAVEDYPFGADVQVFKVAGKMFALVSHHQGYCSINLKSRPDEAVELRDLFSSVLPGYHMNKRHWNTVLLDGSIPDGEIERQIDASFALVVKGLTKAQRQALEIKYTPEQLYAGLRNT